jgi:hypothetical protein
VLAHEPSLDRLAELLPDLVGAPLLGGQSLEPVVQSDEQSPELIRGAAA